jgi:sugar lactone lactonase YvrE
MAGGVAWGPDDRLYVADWQGSHVVRVAPDGTMDDLGLWDTVPEFNNPSFVKFDSNGILYVADVRFSPDDPVWRIDPDGTATALSIAGTPSGGLAIDDQGDVYIGETHSGRILRLRNGKTQVVASGLALPSDIEFGPDGYLYVGQMHDSRVMRIDPDTGAKHVLFDSPVFGDPPYLTVDDDGDIWVFQEGALFQISPSGDLKPFTVDGVQYQYFTDFWWGLTAGIAFDNDGSLWMTAFHGSVVRLQDSGSDTFTTEVIARGFAPTAVAEATDGFVYTHDSLSGEVWRLAPDGSHETLMTFGLGAFVDIAADPVDPIVYVWTPNQEVITVDATSSGEHFAWLQGQSHTSDLVAATDGSLLAVTANPDHTPKEIVRLIGPDEVVTITDELAGQPMGNHDELAIGPGPDAGLYVMSITTLEFFEVDADGDSRLLFDFDDLDAPYRAPYTFISSLDGEIFPYGYDVYRLTDSSQLEPIARYTEGDPIAAFVSSDGSTLYIGELGSIDAIPLRAYDGRFEDDEGSVFESDIEWLAGEAITLGCNPPENTRFCPNSRVTRGQMAAFLVRALGLTAQLDDPFVDDDDSIFEGVIEKLAAAGITRGCNPPLNDLYCPAAAVTRAQMAAFLHRALG